MRTSGVRFPRNAAGSEHSRPVRALGAAVGLLACAGPSFQGELGGGDRLLRAGKQERALARFEAALSLADENTPPAGRIDALLEAADLAARNPRLARQGDAERWLAEAERLGRASFPARHPLRLMLDQEIAHFHVERGALLQARTALERYLARVEWREGPAAAAASLEAGMLERVYQTLGRTEELDAWRAKRAALRASAPETVVNAPAPPAGGAVDRPPGLLAELVLIGGEQDGDLNVDLFTESASSAGGPRLATLDSGIARSAITPAFAHALGVDTRELAGQPRELEMRAGLELRFPLYGPRRGLDAASVYAKRAPVGMDFLRGLLLEVDFEHDRVRLYDSALATPIHDPRAVRLPLRFERGLPEIQLAAGSGSTRALLDLGQRDALVLSEERALELGLVLLSPEPAPAYDDLDAPFESRLILDRVELGEGALRQVPVRVARGDGGEPFSGERVESGASLGLGALRRFARIRLDGPRGELWLVPAQSPQRGPVDPVPGANTVGSPRG